MVLVKCSLIFITTGIQLVNSSKPEDRTRWLVVLIYDDVLIPKFMINYKIFIL